jgi:hypothetical protein
MNTTTEELPREEAKERSHTPGPWRAIEWSCHARTSVVRENDAGVQVYVAECAGLGEDTELAIANARLIAAAPEFLKALVAIERLDGEANTTALPDFRRMLAIASGIARAAIQSSQVHLRSVAPSRES